MICQKCGAEVPEKAAFCERCGAALTNEVAQQVNRRQPKTWLTEAILVTILGCTPFGIVGIVHAAIGNARFNAGDIEGAKRASQQAGKWTKLGFWLGLAAWVFYIIYFVAMIALGGFAALMDHM